MAWRIHEAVQHGEIDNRERGRVVGRIWFAGLSEPVELSLQGDCARDLAGRRLEFRNPHPKTGDLRGLALEQSGAVGDITASRRCRIPDCPIEQIQEYTDAGQPFPWHWGNVLYLEWYGSRNGRVVIESAEFELKIVGEPTWQMTSAEEQQQQLDNQAALAGFMDKLGEAFRASVEKPSAEGESFEPMSEEEAEATQEQSDILSDRINARLERAGSEEDFDRILEEELERMRREKGEPEPTREHLEASEERIEELNAAAEAALRDGPHQDRSWDRERHPLVERVRDLSMRVRSDAETGGWLPKNAVEEHPVADLQFSLMKAGAKLAGALNGEEWPPDAMFCASKIVRLKRARSYLDDALRSLESCREEALIPISSATRWQTDVIGYAAETDTLIGEIRAVLKRARNG